MNTLFNTINIYKSSVIIFVKFQERPKKDYNVESVDQREYLSCSFFNRVFILIASPSRSWNNQIYLRLNENILKFFPATRQSGRSFFSCSFERQPKKRRSEQQPNFFLPATQKVLRDNARIANAVQVTLWLWISNPQWHDMSFSSH